MGNKDRFIDLLKSVNRSGMPELIKWLTEKTDIFTAPASTKYHDSCEGGLLKHSLAVYDCLLKVTSAFEIPVEHDTAIITALLHDLCKANFYKVDTRNVKENGVWKQVPYYAVDDKIPLGHGEKSVILLQAFIRPTTDEIMAIRWHMGASGGGDYETNCARNAAMNKYPIVGALHMADLAACYFMKGENNEPNS